MMPTVQEIAAALSATITASDLAFAEVADSFTLTGACRLFRRCDRVCDALDLASGSPDPFQRATARADVIRSHANVTAHPTGLEHDGAAGVVLVADGINVATVIIPAEHLAAGHGPRTLALVVAGLLG